MLVIYCNWGIGSGAYEDPFAAPGTFSQVIASITAGVRELCPTAAEPKRIGLSAWSAELTARCGASSISSTDAARVDSVLLADGLHAGFIGNEHERNVNPGANGRLPSCSRIRP